MTAAEEWTRCRPMIEAALAESPGLETIEDVERLVEDGSYQVWFGSKSCIVTEIGVYPRGKVLTVVHGGGNLEELMSEMEPNLCAFARQMGCRAVMGIGRKGWERVCKRNGYQFGWIAMIKHLEQ